MSRGRGTGTGEICFQKVFKEEGVRVCVCGSRKRDVINIFLLLFLVLVLARGFPIYLLIPSVSS